MTSTLSARLSPTARLSPAASLTRRASMLRSAAPENVLAGIAYSAFALPVGLILLAALSSFGIGSTVSVFVVALCAGWLYRRGSAGTFSRRGVVVVSTVVLASVGIGFFLTLTQFWAGKLSEQVGLTTLQALATASFWPSFASILPSLVQLNASWLLVALLLGAGGTVLILRRMSRPGVLTIASFERAEDH